MTKFKVERSSNVDAAQNDNVSEIQDVDSISGTTSRSQMDAAPGSARADTTNVDMMSEPEENDGLDHHGNRADTKKNLFLYEEDMKHMPRVATFLRSLASYHTTIPSERDLQNSKSKPKKAKLGVLLGVYLPTIQHIFGVLMFVRLAWIVGCAGTLEAFFMVLMCCITTFVTSISMSAIATNGMVQAGGSYFMISRNLGPECGGAVGICFYLANTFATDLYILGAIEIFLQYMAPSLAFFGDIHKDPYNNFRVYGTVVLLLLTLVVAIGVKFVAFFAPFSLACVIISILCVFIGAFQANETTRDVWICMLDERLLLYKTIVQSGEVWCNKSLEGPLYNQYCVNPNTSTPESCAFFQSANVSYLPGIPGMASGIIKDNLYSAYLSFGEVTPGVQGSHDRGEVVADISASWVLLAAIYFPSVTGIMTGSNMSGDLRDPQKSIPVGTILAQLTTSFVYLSFVLLFGATSHSSLLRDKFGESVGGQLLAANLCWPNNWVVLVGGFCSTIGAALQCITSAPRLLQAIARDNIIPFLDVFQVTRKGEPLRALVLTFFIAEIGILVASLDDVAPLIDVFFLMCYAVVNLTCALQTLLQSPAWRPRFKYYHWTLALLGVALNLALSFIAGWYYAIAAFLIAGFIYKYVEYKGGEKEWGDGIQGLSMTAAQRALLKLDEDPHTKNWRPQILVLCKVDKDTLQPKYDRLFHFTSQLKAGKGLAIYAHVLQGEYLNRAEDAIKTKSILKNAMAEHKVKGFAKVMVSKNIEEGINIFVQTVGLGGMRHNTVVVGWPDSWHHGAHDNHWKIFIDTVKVVTARDLALFVPRGIKNFPDNTVKLSGTIDVWWIIHDGGMLILLSFLLRQHKVWKNCKTRIFTVAQIQDNSIQLEKDLTHFLYQLRIDAEVHVEEMYDNDISAYTVERTLDMEKRAKMLKDLKLERRQTIQGIREEHELRSRQNSIATIQSRQNSLAPHRDSEASGLRMTFDIAAVNKRLKEVESVTSAELEAGDDRKVQFTFTGHQARKKVRQQEQDMMQQDSEGRLKRMHTAVKLNNAIKEKSGDAQLIILNFPAPPAKMSAEENYMDYLDALSEGLNRVLMVRGSGQEVVTIYS